MGKREERYKDEIKNLYEELNEKSDLILELLEREKELRQVIYEKDSEILKWMQKAIELRVYVADTTEVYKI